MWDRSIYSPVPSLQVTLLTESQCPLLQLEQLSVKQNNPPSPPLPFSDLSMLPYSLWLFPKVAGILENDFFMKSSLCLILTCHVSLARLIPNDEIAPQSQQEAMIYLRLTWRLYSTDFHRHRTCCWEKYNMVKLRNHRHGELIGPGSHQIIWPSNYLHLWEKRNFHLTSGLHHLSHETRKGNNRFDQKRE